MNHCITTEWYNACVTADAIANLLQAYLHVGKPQDQRTSFPMWLPELVMQIGWCGLDTQIQSDHLQYGYSVLKRNKFDLSAV